MKKLKLNKILLIIIMMVPILVLADGAAPTLVSIEVVVSNKNGAVCYESEYKNGQETFIKTDKVIPFGATLKIEEDFNDKYIYAYSENDDEISSCLLKNSDIKLKKDTFDIKDAQVDKLEPLNGVIFASKLNMRKGPSTSYGVITTIPKGEVVKLTHRAGTWWFYAEYNGKKGWISGNNQYLGYNNSDIIYSTSELTIYDGNGKEIGKIPPLTEVTNYVQFASFEGTINYVEYNGIKGYIYGANYKCLGKITLLKDANLYQNDKVVKTIKNGTVLEYTNQDYTSDYEDIYEFYIPKEKGIVKVKYDNFKYLGDVTYPKKNSGYIGEGYFGEKKDDKVSNSGKEYVAITPTDEPENDYQENNKENKNNSYHSYAYDLPKEKSNTELIIICVLGSIVLAITIVIVILLINRKKSIKKEEIKQEKIKKEKEVKKDQKENDKKGDENAKENNEKKE